MANIIKKLVSNNGDNIVIPKSSVDGLETALDSKQNTLTAGEGITIDGGTISATGNVADVQLDGNSILNTTTHIANIDINADTLIHTSDSQGVTPTPMTNADTLDGHDSTYFATAVKDGQKISYVETQTLTTAQKAIARQNIGVNTTETVIGSGVSSVNTLTGDAVLDGTNIKYQASNPSSPTIKASIDTLTDDKANKIDLAMTEASTTASVAHSAGDYFYLNNELYITTADIAASGVITVGTNCKRIKLSEEVSDLKSALNATAILKNESDLTVTRKFIARTGRIETIANDNFYVSDFIKLPEQANRIAVVGGVISNPTTMAVAFYSRQTSASFISGAGFDGSDIFLNVPEHAKYVVFASNTDALGVVKDVDYRAIYIEPLTVADYDPVPTAEYSKVLEPTYIDGKFINWKGKNVNLPSNPGFKRTDFIPLENTDVAIVNKSTNIVNNPSVLLVAFYETANDFNSFISGVPATASPINVTIPQKAKYVILSGNTDSSGTYTELDEDTYITGIMTRTDADDSQAATLKCPESYDLVVGDKFELFYKGIVKSFADENFLVDATCDIGANYKKRFIVTPSSAGTKTLTLKLYDDSDTLIDLKTINLIARSVPSNPGSVKNVLCVGDSLTVHGEWVKELKRRIAQSGGTPTGYNLSNVHFIGSCEADGANYEGHSGWTFTSYNTANVVASVKNITCTHDKTEAEDQHSVYQDGAGGQWKLETISSGTIKIILVSGNAGNFPATGTLTWVSGGTHHSDIVYTASANAPGNPFWDESQNKVDFATYASRIGASGIDIVLVLLGWNSAGSSKADYKETVQTFINNVKASYPNAKIMLMGLQIPSRDGLGANYGASGTWSHYINLLNYVHDLDDWYDELAGSNTNVYHINISGQFDTEHNMPKSTRAVNSRNTETEVYQTNGIHPAESGYLQIADAATRSLIGLISQ